MKEGSMQVTQDGGWTVVPLAGEVDVASVVPIREAIGALSDDEARWVRFDLAGVTFFDSHGFRLLAMANKRARALGGGVQVVGASGWLRRLFVLSGLSWLLYPPKSDGFGRLTLLTES